ncbi:MAG: hypothetical protein A3I08_05300 [Candidatus Andersenbacteria bacterium RIFCSPLOWO2_02_FULL_46_11]|nr:MAG: hypothetical protein A3I08_05300 [Candidatus Andersenbacteria bacterium RIFCSPLOWO2_02_FULL_46_11]
MPAALITSFLILLILSLQYPLSTTFPIGGDAAFYARRAQVALQFFDDPTASIQALKNSWYPLSLAIFSATNILPLDWPSRFTWSMVIAHVSVGICLALLLRRIGGWPSAALVMIIWAVTTTSINSNFEDGTLAQLISFSFLALFLERFTAGAKWSALLALIATPLTHPITGLALLVSLLVTTPALFSAWSSLTAPHKKQLLLICPINFLLLLLVLFTGKSVFSTSKYIIGVAKDPFINVLVSSYAPFVTLAPLGLLLLLRSAAPTTAKYIIAILFSLSVMLAGNDLLEIAVWTQRLLPLFIFFVSILASLSLSHIIQTVYKSNFSRVLFSLVIVAYFCTAAWISNSRVYRYYENPANYARLHPDELAAMYWLRDHLTKNSYITTSDKNRHTEWLPVITSLQWLAVSPDDESLINPTNDQIDSLTYRKQKYVAYFTQRENIPTPVLESPGRYPLVFSNQSVAVYHVPPYTYE